MNWKNINTIFCNLIGIYYLLFMEKIKKWDRGLRLGLFKNDNMLEN